MDLNTYLHQKYGKKLYKLPINAGFTCPNRDGTKGEGGCIFCSGTGSGDFAADPSLCVHDQLDLAKERISSKISKGDHGYIAYFQAFTNTYAPVRRLEKLYYEALSYPGVEVISIATRPDCLPEEVLDLLCRINMIKPVWVELGLQTVNENTARYIRRGYTLQVYDEAVKKLKDAGIEVIVHVILGLPGETEEDMLKTVDHVVKSGAEGIKLQLLHVLSGTDLAKDYEAGKFECMSLEQYVELVGKCLEHIPPEMVIHRMTGDGDKKILIAPKWSGDKKRVLNSLNRLKDNVNKNF